VYVTVLIITFGLVALVFGIEATFKNNNAVKAEGKSSTEILFINSTKLYCINPSTGAIK
jgi:hypothetical protein